MPFQAQRFGRIPVQAPILLALLLAAALAIVKWRADAIGEPNKLVVSGTVEGDIIALGSRVGGRLATMEVREGDTLLPGQLVATFSAPELEAQKGQITATTTQAEALARKLENGPRKVDLAQAYASILTAKAQLAELEAGSRREDIATAEASSHAAQLLYEQSMADLRRAEELFAQGVIPQSQVEQARTNASRLKDSADAAKRQHEKALAGPRDTQIEIARAQVKQAEAAYAQIAAGSRQEDIDAARAAVSASLSQLDILDTQLDELQVTAPAKGVVLSINHKPGDLLLPNQPVCNLLLADSYFVQVYVPENKLAWAAPGARARLRVDGLEYTELWATVEFLSTQGEFTPRNLQTKEKRVEQVFRCKLRVDDTQGLIRPGMVCDVEFTLPQALETFEVPSGKS
jgi:multidrug resistance efflux pump